MGPESTPCTSGMTSLSSSSNVHVAAAVLSLGQAEVTEEHSGGSSFKCTAESHKQHVPGIHQGLTGQLRNAPFHQNKNFAS